MESLVVFRRGVSPSVFAHLPGAFDARTFWRRGPVAERARIRQWSEFERQALRVAGGVAFSAAHEMPDGLRGTFLQVQVHERDVPPRPSRMPSASLQGQL